MTRREAEDFENSVLRLRRLFQLGLWLVAALWLLLIPGAQIWMGYHAFQTEGKARTGMAADRLSSYVFSHLETWEYEGDRLLYMTRDSLRGGEHHAFRTVLSDGEGRVVFEDNGASVLWPWLVADIEDTISDGRRVVGHLRVSFSLYALVRPVQVAFLGGLISMVVLLYLGRFGVSRALDRSLHEVELRGRQLSSRVHELELTREELARQLKEREKDQRQLSRHGASLEMAGADFSHVAQLAAHHLQEPLRTILSYSQLLLRWHESTADESDKAGEYVKYIGGGVARMKGQLKALSAYMTLREADFTCALMDLGSVLEEVAAAKARLLVEAGATLQWNDLPVVVSNRDRLRAVLESLVETSLRWRDPHRRHQIKVSAHSTPDHWVVKVVDNGLPLASRDPDHLFQLLVHDEPGHTVIGLAPARLTVFLLGGSLWAEEDEDGAVGFCFTVAVPEE
ncbi:MAG: ATP-binding protein [Magnetospirillum sp.]